MDPSKVNLSAIEKAMKLKWALTFFAMIFFADTYMLVMHDVNIWSVDKVWANSNITYSEAIKIMAFFTGIFSLAIPGVTFFFKLVFGMAIITVEYKLRAALKFPEPNYILLKNELSLVDYIHKDDLRRWAIFTNNTAAYREYEAHKIEKSDKDFISYLCQTIMIISFIGYIFSNENNLSIMELANLKIDELPLYFYFPLSVTFLIAILWLFGVGFRSNKDKEYDDYIHMPNHGIEAKGNAVGK